MQLPRRFPAAACRPSLASVILLGACALAGMAGAQSFATVDLPSFQFPEKGAFERGKSPVCLPLFCAGRGERTVTGEAVTGEAGTADKTNPKGKSQ